MSEDDKKTAVGISVTLSGQLITAALAMVAVEGAFVAFALGNRNVFRGFEWLSGLTAILFILSIFVAGKGITKARNDGFNGAWNLQTTKNHFNWQAILCVLGLVSFFVTLLLSGGPKKRDRGQARKIWKADINCRVTDTDHFQRHNFNKKKWGRLRFKDRSNTA